MPLQLNFPLLGIVTVQTGLPEPEVTLTLAPGWPDPEHVTVLPSLTHLMPVTGAGGVSIRTEIVLLRDVFPAASVESATNS